MKVSETKSVTRCDLIAASALPDAYLTEDEFCEHYRVSRRTAQRWRVTGDGPRWVRMGKRRVAYRLSDCEAWAAGLTYAHRADELTQQVA